MEAANWQDQSSYPSTYDFGGMTPQMLAAMMQHFGSNGVNMPGGGGVNMPGMPSEFQLMMEVSYTPLPPAPPKCNSGGMKSV